MTVRLPDVPPPTRRSVVGWFKDVSQATLVRKNALLQYFLQENALGQFILTHTTADQWTWSRYPLSVAFVALAISRHFGWAGLVLLISGLTDLADGAIAEAQGTASNAGTKKDTVSDGWEFLCVAGVVWFCFGHWQWYLTLIVASLFEVIRFGGGYHFERRGLATEETYRPNLPGRIKNVFYHAAVIALLWGIPGLPYLLFWAGIVSSFISLQLHWFTYGQSDPKQR